MLHSENGTPVRHAVRRAHLVGGSGPELSKLFTLPGDHAACEQCERDQIQQSRLAHFRQQHDHEGQHQTQSVCYAHIYKTLQLYACTV